MTTRRELDEVLDACDACAGEDSGSYYEHFLSCGQCRDYADLAEKFEQRVVSLQEMASRSDEERRKWMGDWLQGVLDMPREEGSQALEDHLDVLAEVPMKVRERVVRDRLDLFMKLSKEKRDAFLGMMQGICTGWNADRRLTELQSTLRSCEDYPFLERMLVRRKFGEILG